VKQQIATQGAETVGGSADQFREFMLAEVAKWAKVIKGRNITND